ncbi:cytochrome b N-terminal domain-containing protein [Bdellovibrionota bacterium FG-2]
MNTLKKLWSWLDQRANLNNLLTVALKEPIPGGPSWAYVFGSGLIFIFTLQALTGVLLALYYTPSADHAYITITYISKEVSSGSLIRGIHSYGSSAMVIMVVLHLSQTFLWGAYKGRREILWLSGCVLLTLILGMSFTGYLLPWDQKAYFATAVGTSVAGEVPFIGDLIKRFMRGGNDMGTLTLSRFFAAHVLFIPALIAALISVHVYLFRRAGAAGPFTADPLKPKGRVGFFYPNQLLMDIALAALIIAALAFIAATYPAELGPQANPSDTQFLGRPEWYYRPMFQWLKYWNSPYTLIGIMVIPAIVGALLAGAPFLDRKLERRPWRRPIPVAIYIFVLGGLTFMGWQSYHDDDSVPTIKAQLKAQDEETQRTMKTPFEPEVASTLKVDSTSTQLSAAAETGKGLFIRNACFACHGQNGVGGRGPRLVGIGSRMSSDQVFELLRHPRPSMLAGGMIPSPLKDTDLRALIEYLKSL